MGLFYVTLGSNDIARAKAWYAPVMAALNANMIADYPDAAFCYELQGGGQVWITKPHNGAPATFGNGVTIGIATQSEAQVQAAHAACLQAGGTNEGDPGPRPQYGPEFYGAYARDLEGNKLAFVYYRPQ
jgi:hypothetical protein